MFSGSRTENPAYSRDQLTGQVSYEGDNRQSKISINETRDLEKNRDGQSIFQSITRRSRSTALQGYLMRVISIFGQVVCNRIWRQCLKPNQVSAMQRALDRRESLVLLAPMLRMV